MYLLLYLLLYLLVYSLLFLLQTFSEHAAKQPSQREAALGGGQVGHALGGNAAMYNPPLDFSGKED